MGILFESMAALFDIQFKTYLCWSNLLKSDTLQEALIFVNLSLVIGGDKQARQLILNSLAGWDAFVVRMFDFDHLSHQVGQVN